MNSQSFIEARKSLRSFSKQKFRSSLKILIGFVLAGNVLGLVLQYHSDKAWFADTALALSAFGILAAIPVALVGVTAWFVSLPQVMGRLPPDRYSNCQRWLFQIVGLAIGISAGSPEGHPIIGAIIGIVAGLYVSKADWLGLSRIHALLCWSRSDENRAAGQDAKQDARGPAHDPYVILGCDRGAGLDEIKKRYRVLAQQFHPDKLSGTGLSKEFVDFANERFRQIQSAFEAIERERATVT